MIAHAMPSTRPIPDTFLEALSHAIASERQLIDELAQVILRQREAVAADDLQAVDDSVFATHRLLIALGEVRKRRHSLNRLFGYSEDVGGEVVGGAFGAQMPPQLRSEHDALRQAARRLSKEIGINRGMLKKALATSDECGQVVY
ncbi:MAG TPA: hypothetical protein VNU46_03935 [Gemmatimonadaceae bacterium]|jgi:hypothetical protein|nr:hypothetical protein [Gemmatimonadaceae bacterium]